MFDKDEKKNETKNVNIEASRLRVCNNPAFCVRSVKSDGVIDCPAVVFDKYCNGHGVVCDGSSGQDFEDQQLARNAEMFVVYVLNTIVVIFFSSPVFSF